MILGLDISSSRIGIALLDGDKLLISETIKLKSNLSLEERAEIFEKRMKQIDRNYVVYDVYIEQPALMFRGGKTTAQTMATLQRFNGMCSYIVYNIFEVCPLMINPRSARSKLGIKTPRKAPQREVKRCIIDHVQQRFPTQFKYELTRHGNPQPGTDDRADAIVIAVAGPMLDNL